MKRKIVIRSGGYAYVPKKNQKKDVRKIEAFSADIDEFEDDTSAFDAIEDNIEQIDFEQDTDELEKTTILYPIGDKDEEELESADDSTRLFAPTDTVVFDEGTKTKKSKAPKAKQPLFIKRTKPRNFALRVCLTTLLMFFVVFLGIGFSGLGVLNGFVNTYAQTTPELDVSLIADQDEATSIYDANGELITTFIAYENREWAKIGEIPDMLKNAFIAVEDVRFYQHDGVDYKRLFGAVKGVFSGNYDGGGSTITQQLVKIQVLGNEQSYKRKVQEADLAFQLEKTLTKDQILEAYLNAIHLGDSNYGVKAAAEDYFGKSMDQLTIRECAMLAGLTQNPSGYNPRKNMYQRNDMTRTDERTNTVLRRMYSGGFITKEQYNEALVENVTILENSKVKQLYDMPSFVEYSIYNVITHMLRKENLQDNKTNRDAMERKLRVSGYRIYTTVDPTIQHSVQDTVANWDDYPNLRNPARGVVRETQTNGDVLETIQPQVAAVIIDHKTGQIKALVGRREEATQLKLLNRAYSSRMEVGSSIKPISVFAPALEKGASPASIYMNYPVSIDGYGGERGYPLGGLGQTGPVTMREGVVKSLNVIAARTLFETVGIENSKQTLIRLGIDPSGINADGPGLALGTTTISPLEMVAAYATLANEGVYLEPVAFTKVVDRDGNVILDAEKVQEKSIVFQPSTAYLITDMLQEAVESGTGTKAQIANMNVAGKTGTNADYRSVYFAGYTPYYTASLWIGHDSYAEDAKLQSGSTGGTYAAPLWSAFMAPIHKGLSNKDIMDKTPAELGLVQREVCSVSGHLATDACRSDKSHAPVTDWFTISQVPTETCEMHQYIDICKDSGRVATEYCPESSRRRTSVIITTSKTPLGTIPMQLLRKDFNYIYVDISRSRLNSLTVGSSAYDRYACDVHTPTGSGPVTREQAQALIAEVRNLLDSGSIDPTLAIEMSTAADQLESLLNLDSSQEVIENQCSYLQNLINQANGISVDTSSDDTIFIPDE